MEKDCNRGLVQIKPVFLYQRLWTGYLIHVDFMATKAELITGTLWSLIAEKNDNLNKCLRTVQGTGHGNTA